MTTTRLPIVYRCGPSVPTASKLVFTDLTDCRSGALEDRIGLGRALTASRLLNCPCAVLVASEDLPDLFDQHLVALLLEPGGSQLIVDGRPVQADRSRFPVLEVIAPVAVSNGARVRPRSQSDLPEVCWAMRDGLRLTGREVADVLNKLPLWRSRSSGVHGFTEQAVSHYAGIGKQDLPPLWERDLSDQKPNLGQVVDLRPGEIDAIEAESWAEVADMIRASFTFSFEMLVPDGWELLSPVEYLVLERSLIRNGSTLTGSNDREVPVDTRRMIDHALEFILRVVQQEYLRRTQPAEDRSLAAATARRLAADGKTLQAIANDLNRQGFRSQRRGRWHRSAVRDLLHSNPIATEAS